MCKKTAFLLLLVFPVFFPFCAEKSVNHLPNIILIIADDLGYSDLNCYSADNLNTPGLDSLVSNGMLFTDFYVPQTESSPSMAAIHTGCYPAKYAITKDLDHESTVGINQNISTIAELLKNKGYATALFGKWHLGVQKEFLPLQHGFDEYFGIPYSNDMWPYNPEKPFFYPPLPLINGDSVIAFDPKQSDLIKWYTEYSLKFISENKENPFFLCISHSAPHVPLFVSKKFKDKSRRGLYQDALMELDWSVAEIYSMLKSSGINSKTLVFFISDGGPWLSFGNHAGSAKPLKHGKFTVWEGGVRVPCIVYWPGTIKPNSVCSQPFMTIDILPTLEEITQTKITEHPVDGKSMLPVLSGKDRQSPHDALFYFIEDKLLAVRHKNWKLHLPHAYPVVRDSLTGLNGVPAKYDTLTTDTALFDLYTDKEEKNNIAGEFPNIVKEIAYLSDSLKQVLHIKMD